MNVLTCFLILKLLFGHQRSDKLYHPDESVQGTIGHDQSNRNAEFNVVRRNFHFLSPVSLQNERINMLSYRKTFIWSPAFG